jgi:hypothetical protein
MWGNVDDSAQIVELSNGMTFIANYRYNLNREGLEKTNRATANLDSLGIEND